MQDIERFISGFRTFRKDYTIISLAGERPLLIRPGAIGPGELSETIGL